MEILFSPVFKPGNYISSSTAGAGQISAGIDTSAPADDALVLQNNQQLSLIDPARINTGNTQQVSATEKTTLPDTMIGVVEQDRYANALDVTSSLVPGPVGIGMTPEKPSLSFQKLLESQESGSPFQQKVGCNRYSDPEGDAHLIRRLDTVPEKLMNALSKALVHREPKKGTNTVQSASKDFIIGSENPVKVDALFNRFVKIIQDHPEITPTVGEEHRWSPDAKKHLNGGFWKRLGGFLRGKQDFPAPIFGTKLFMTLACGWTTNYCITGKEPELYDRLMQYPDRSLQLHDVLEESYVLNKGNLYETLMTAENVLGVGIYNEDRDNQPLQKKLQYLRNDSTQEGDNFAAWYHFFGIALYGLKRPPVLARSVALIEAAGSLFLEGPDRQETFFNVNGAKFGGKLRKMMKEESWKQPLSPTTDMAYMNLTEFQKNNFRPLD